MDHDLDRFVTAQAPLWEQIRAELAKGRKTSHWMWFVFPQAAGLGRSAMARRYAIGSLAEARAYLAHPLLGARLRTAIALVLRHRDAGAERIFGPIDALKLRSSLTLFDIAGGGAACADVLAAFYPGPDPATLALVRGATSFNKESV